MFVSIDGAVGAGKSSVLESLKKLGKAISPEPVESWGEHIEKLYAGTMSPYEFQCIAFEDRCAKVPDARGEPVVYVERSPFFQKRVFLEANMPRMTVEEAERLSVLYTSHVKWDPCLYIYLRAPPDVCLERIASRGRRGEDKITTGYNEKLHELHERAYEDALATGMKIVTLDASTRTPDEIASSIVELL